MKMPDQKHTQKTNIKAYKTNANISSESTKNKILPFLIAFAAPFLLYLQTLSFDLTFFDDDQLITKNIAFLSDPRNAAAVFLKNAFISSSSSFYRPLQSLSYMADIVLSGGNNPWMYHLTNIILMGAIAVLLFLLLKQFLLPDKLALLGSLIYCTHPLFVSSVAWIPARGDLQLTVFSLISFLFFIRFINSRKVKYMVYTWAAFTLALFCKETAAVLPLVFILYSFTYSPKEQFDRKFLFLVGLFLISGILWFWLRAKAIGGFTDGDNAFGPISLLSNWRILPESLAKFFFPFNNSPIPGYTIFQTLTGLVIIIALLFLFLRNKTRPGKEKMFFFLWFLIFLMPPMLYRVPLLDYLDHRFLLPMIGILLFILSVIPSTWFVKKDNNKSWILIVIILFLSSFTFIKSLPYRDSITFYTKATLYNPNSAFSFNNLGNLKFYRDDVESSIDDYTKAIELKPDYGKAYINRGVAYIRLGSYNHAVTDLTSAIKVTDSAKTAEAYSNRGAAYYHLGLYSDAIRDYTKAIEVNPLYPGALYNRGVAYDDQGLFEKALADYTQAIKLNPDDFDALINRGYAFYKRKLFKNAIDDYTRVLEIKPENAEIYYSRGNSYYQLELYDKAINDYSKVLELSPGFSEVLINRGLAYLKQNKRADACNDFNKSLESGNKSAETFILKYCK